MARKRDYREEYRKRIESGKRRGLTFREAQGKRAIAPPEQPIPERVIKALQRILKGETPTEAAKKEHTALETLRRYEARGITITRELKGVPMTPISDGQIVLEDGESHLWTPEQASIIGKYLNDVKKAKRYEDPTRLYDWKGVIVTDIDGNDYELETDLNAILAVEDDDIPLQSDVEVSYQ